MKRKKTMLKDQSEIPPMQLSEPEVVYQKQVKAQPSLKDFSYNEFKKIADKTPFTQAEWAAMLHVSERTLQRYAKSNSHFAPINAERALQIANVLKRAKDVLGKIDNFYTWIKRRPQALEGQLSFDSLTTADGINKILIQLGRIEHGLFA
jgi:putative toxin-antitoxin system antitoxin component (TIGR02293 family)